MGEFCEYRLNDGHISRVGVNEFTHVISAFYGRIGRNSEKEDLRLILPNSNTFCENQNSESRFNVGRNGKFHNSVHFTSDFDKNLVKEMSTASCLLL